MKLEKRVEAQRKIMDSLTAQIKDLTEENNKLRTQNADLKFTVAKAESAYKEYKSLIDELLELKEKYSAALTELLDMKSTYTKKFKQQLKRIRKEK